LCHNEKTTGTTQKLAPKRPISRLPQLQQIKGIGFQKPPHKPLQFYTILRNSQLFVAIPEQTVKSPVQRKQPRKPSERYLTHAPQKKTSTQQTQKLVHTHKTQTANSSQRTRNENKASTLTVFSSESFKSNPPTHFHKDTTSRSTNTIWPSTYPASSEAQA
jgi:hypothetical protein